jgi:hypothetical protein
MSKPTRRTRSVCCARGERPRGCRAADKRDELAALQLIELHLIPPAKPDFVTTTGDSKGALGPAQTTACSAEIGKNLKHDLCIQARL